MSSDETAKEALSFIFRTAQKAPKLFKTIKQVIDLIIGLNEEQRRKIELNNYAKKVNWSEFSYSERNAEDLKIFKDTVKKYGVEHSIFKGKDNPDGTSDYVMKLYAKDLEAIKKALKEFSSKLEKMYEKTFDSKLERANRRAEQKNEARTQNRERGATKSRSKGIEL